jgi:hypothetical protein
LNWEFLLSETSVLIYFGAGGSGAAYCEHSGQLPDLFIDNDKAKWGKKLKDVIILSPTILDFLPIEKIVITSGYISSIKSQLQDLGVSSDKIQVIPKSLQGYHCFTSEENRAYALEKFHELTDALSEECTLVAVGGTALGFVRDRDFIHWDNDADFFAPNSSRGMVVEVMQKIGLEVQEEPGDVMSSVHSVIYVKNGIDIPFSIDFFNEKEETFTDTFEEYTWQWPTKMFIHCKKIKVGGKWLNVPNPPEDYLSGVYGKDWQVQKRDFGYDDYGGNSSK